jgi:hypothetical protein
MVVFQLDGGPIAGPYTWTFYDGRYHWSEEPSVSLASILKQKRGPVPKFMRFNEPVFLALFPEAKPEDYDKGWWVELRFDFASHTVMARATSSDNPKALKASKSKKQRLSWVVSTMGAFNGWGLFITRNQTFTPEIKNGVVGIPLWKGYATRKTKFAARRGEYEGGRPVGTKKISDRGLLEFKKRAAEVVMSYYDDRGKHPPAAFTARELSLDKKTYIDTLERLNFLGHSGKSPHDHFCAHVLA